MILTLSIVRHISNEVAFKNLSGGELKEFELLQQMKTQLGVLLFGNGQGYPTKSQSCLLLT